jgi:hypothetical protein
MNSTEILTVLRSDQVLSQMIVGVFPIDKIPPPASVPSGFVINLDKHTLPGSHWVALYIDTNSKCEFFDSYGLEPNKQIRNYIEKHFSVLKYNRKCVQKFFTASCGQLCIYFLVWRVRGVPMKTIAQSLELEYSDEFVVGFVNNLFRINTVVYDKEFIVDQICRQMI